MAVSRVTPRAPVTRARAPASRLCGRDSPRNLPPRPRPPALTSRWAGPARKRASETQHPERGEGGGETEPSRAGGSRRLEKVQKDSSLFHLSGFRTELSASPDAERRRRCGRVEVSGARRVEGGNLAERARGFPLPSGRDT